MLEETFPSRRADLSGEIRPRRPDFLTPPETTPVGDRFATGD
jgi:hypothetical protein